MTDIIIFDTEATTWEGATQSGWTGENQYREMVQIAALKINRATCDVVDSLDILVRPKINPILSDLFIQLTGITQEQVDLSGVPFDSALKFFMDFCGPSSTVFSYGPDSLVLAENVALNHCYHHGLYGADCPNFMNIGPMFHKIDPSIRANTINSGKLWAHFGLPKPHEAAEHNALFDCYSILAALKHLRSLKKIAL